MLGKRLELTGMRADGTEFPVEITVTRIGAQEPPMFAGYIRDLTEEKQAAQSVERLAAIVEHSNDAISPSSRAARCSRGTRAPSASTATRPRRRSGATSASRSRLTTRRSRPTWSGAPTAARPCRTTRPSGSAGTAPWSTSRLTLSPLSDPDGALIGTAAIIRDITQQKREERRAAFIADAVQILDGSLDFEVVVRNLVRLVVPRLADWCAIHVPEQPDSIRLIAVRHSNPEREQRAWELDERYPTHFDQPEGVPLVLRTGEPLLFPEISDELLVEGTTDEDHLRLARELGLRSAMVVPLRARGETFGTITFVSAESDRLFDESDLTFAAEFARRASLSIDNARLYARRRGAPAQELEFLARASAELDSSLDLEETLQSVADLTVPYLADGCMVDLLDEHETIRRVASASALDDRRTPSSTGCATHHLELRQLPSDRASRCGPARCRSCEEVTDELRGANGRPTSPTWRTSARWPARSAVVAPMRARGRTLGTIALASFTDRKFTAARSRRSRSSRAGPRSRSTTRGSTASAATSPRGSSTACCRRTCRMSRASRSPRGSARRARPTRSAATSTTSSRPATGSWAIVIGDVCGKGADAAALTAIARYTLRATGDPRRARPERVLSLLNEVLLHAGAAASSSDGRLREPRRRATPARSSRSRAPATRCRCCCGRTAASSRWASPGTLLGVVPDIELHESPARAARRATRSSSTRTA